eukprot:gene10869-biopygen1394
MRIAFTYQCSGRGPAQLPGGRDEDRVAGGTGGKERQRARAQGRRVGRRHAPPPTPITA